MKIYLDDERKTPDGWVRCYWPQEVRDLIDRVGLENITHISLDHDLGDDDRGTGYDVVTYLEEMIFFDKSIKTIPEITVHSANSSARQKMLRGIDAIKGLVEYNRDVSPTNYRDTEWNQSWHFSRNTIG
ncbi:hypothetical protein UFOVP273_96 [uncultured Caudovirales phage]|uniref:Cyclic-phosphate processing Receiver domain-containing protein n=1 Tax=uncultured Caudovirales phage TaxID=2100421 RepID=A0A6J5LN65_9CAUD|nr:hypothetical protein UFOVP273_96 [uncultured Caudovirales phage]